jgi:hypothetical protein
MTGASRRQFLRTLLHRLAYTTTTVPGPANTATASSLDVRKRCQSARHTLRPLDSMRGRVVEPDAPGVPK